MNRWTRLGIEAYRAGNREQAQRFFRFALMEKPDDIHTLLWMVEVTNTDTEKERCLEQVLEIDPDQVLARQALLDVKARIHTSQLPHVNPFSEEGSGDLPAASPAAIEVRSTPPFMKALAEHNPQLNVSPTSPSQTGITPIFQKNWIWVGMATLVLVILIYFILNPF